MENPDSTKRTRPQSASKRPQAATHPPRNKSVPVASNEEPTTLNEELQNRNTELRRLDAALVQPAPSSATKPGRKETSRTGALHHAALRKQA